MSASGKLRRMCNNKYAAILVRVSLESRIIYGDKRHIIAYCRTEVIDSFHKAAYITLRVQRRIGLYGQAHCQSRAPQGTRQLEPPSRVGAGRLVSDRRLLRRSRPGAGQVRDASPSSARGRLQSRDRRTLRGVPSHVLSSPSGARPRWPSGIAAASEGTQGRTQAHRRDHELHRAASVGRSADPCSRSRPADQSRVKTLGASAQHRTRSGAEKKTADPAAATSAAGGTLIAAAGSSTVKPVQPDSLQSSITA